MPTSPSPLLVLTNVPDLTVARAVARQLVEKRLAACVNIVPGMQSVYRWQGQVEQADEVVLFIKTTTDRYADVERAIVDVHPYEVPEVIAMPITEGLPSYVAWLAQETRKEFDV